MFQRQVRQEVLVCPDCEAKLVRDQELLICHQHGAFFLYGPQLLVRAPRPAAKPQEPSMPWENTRTLALPTCSYFGMDQNAALQVREEML
jgi:hypothetical protein